MDGNYGWQQQQTNQRIQAAMQEAQSHRLAKQNVNAGDEATGGFSLFSALRKLFFEGRETMSTYQPGSIREASHSKGSID